MEQLGQRDMRSQPFFGCRMRQVEMQPDEIGRVSRASQPIDRLAGIDGQATPVGSKSKAADQSRGVGTIVRDGGSCHDEASGSNLSWSRPRMSA